MLFLGNSISRSLVKHGLGIRGEIPGHKSQHSAWYSKSPIDPEIWLHDFGVLPLEQGHREEGCEECWWEKHHCHDGDGFHGIGVILRRLCYIFAALCVLTSKQIENLESSVRSLGIKSSGVDLDTHD